MTDSSKGNYLGRKNAHNPSSALHYKELKLSLIKELKAILKNESNCVSEPLEIKHTFPIGFGMFES